MQKICKRPKLFLMQFKSSRYMLDIPIPRFENMPEADRLLFSQRTGKILRISRKYLDHLYAGNLSAMPFRLFCLLFDCEMLIPADEEEESVIATRKDLEAGDRGSHSATLLIPLGDTPGDIFWDQLVARLHDTLNSFPPSKIKGLDYRLILLTVLDRTPPPPGWFASLDNRIPQSGAGRKIIFSLHLALQASTLDRLVIPPLHKLTLDKLIVVFNAKADVPYEPAVLEPIERWLANTATFPRLKVQIVFECAGGSWETWKKPFVDALASLSMNDRITLEFAADANDPPGWQGERSLIHFLSAGGVKSKWLPHPRRLCLFSPVEDRLLLSGTTRNEDSIRVLNIEQHWDGDEILQLPGISAMQFYRSNQPRGNGIGFEHTLKERILATAGILLK